MHWAKVVDCVGGVALCCASKEAAESSYGSLLPSVDHGECEHSGSEFMRMNRKLYELGVRGIAYMLPAIVAKFRALS